MTQRWPTLIACLLAALPAAAQETQLQADLRLEGEHVRESCGTFDLKAAGGCVLSLATEEPFHVALGSLAPGNGFGFGLAFVEHYTPNENWRLGWNADTVVTPGGNWRAGVYMKIIRTARAPVTVVRAPGAAARPTVAIREYPVVNLYVQATSLDTLSYYGLGPSTTEAGKSVFGERQTIAGASAILPLTKGSALASLRASFIGGVNGRFITVRGNTSSSAPSIQQLYDDSSAPGLSSQSAFVQFEEGVRLKPAWFHGWVQPNYLVDLQQFASGGNSNASFRRWSIDIRHDMPFYRSVRSSGPRDTNGPDECAQAVGTTRCPSISRNRDGSIGVRLLATSSTAFAGSTVPFYFQPTLGGSDIDGNRLLSSYQDYRFRGPNVMAIQETFEHTLWGGPLGVYLLAEQGKVAMDRSDLGFGGLARSFAAGVSLRAGGFPVINIAFAWGNAEGHHVLATMDSSLLGGSSRPSLY